MIEVPMGYEIPRDRAKIWRYMDFTVFMSLLDKSALFFPLVCELDDPMEGVYPDENREMEHAHPSPGDSPEDLVNKVVRPRFVAKHGQEGYREMMAVNCWHVNEGQSVAMWKTYGRQGIAVQSTCKRLKRSLETWPFDVMYAARVKYVRGLISGKSMSLFEPSLHKRKSYEYEKELRAFIFRHSQMNRPDIPDSKMFRKHSGVYVDVCLEDLIGKVYVSPIAQEWFKNLVDSVMDRYGVKKKVEKSDLAMSGSLY